MTTFFSPQHLFPQHSKPGSTFSEAWRSRLKLHAQIKYYLTYIELLLEELPLTWATWSLLEKTQLQTQYKVLFDSSFSPNQFLSLQFAHQTDSSLESESSRTIPQRSCWGRPQIIYAQGYYFGNHMIDQLHTFDVYLMDPEETCTPVPQVILYTWYLDHGEQIKSYRGWNTHCKIQAVITSHRWNDLHRWFTVHAVTALLLRLNRSNWGKQSDFNPDPFVSRIKPPSLTSIPVPGPVCVDSLCSAVARAVDVFVFGTVRPPQHFAGRSDVWGVAHLLVPVVPSWMALGWVFESLRRQITHLTCDRSSIMCSQWLQCIFNLTWRTFRPNRCPLSFNARLFWQPERSLSKFSHTRTLLG